MGTLKYAFIERDQEGRFSIRLTWMLQKVQKHQYGYLGGKRRITYNTAKIYYMFLLSTYSCLSTGFPRLIIDLL